MEQLTQDATHVSSWQDKQQRVSPRTLSPPLARRRSVAAMTGLAALVKARLLRLLWRRKRTRHVLRKMLTGLTLLLTIQNPLLRVPRTLCFGDPPKVVPRSGWVVDGAPLEETSAGVINFAP